MTFTPDVENNKKKKLTIKKCTNKTLMTLAFEITHDKKNCWIKKNIN